VLMINLTDYFCEVLSTTFIKSGYRTMLTTTCRIFFLFTVLLLMCSLFISESLAQTPIENGISLHEVTDGLKGPSSIALDSVGQVYVASIYDKNGSGYPTDIYRVLPGGTVEIFTAPILDPDVLCLDNAGNIYVGSWPGQVTLVDPVSGLQTTWINNTTLGNIDGMTFDANGDMLVSAIDHSKIHRINSVTKQITLFSDLTALGLQGLGSLAVNPSDQSVFVASPKDGDLVHLNSDGSLASAALVTGFQHMGQLAIDGDFIFVSDNVAGTLFKVEISTGKTSVFVDKIDYYAGGLLSAGNGEFLATRQSANLIDGRLYSIRPMTTSLGAAPSIGGSLILNLESAADANRELFLFMTIATASIPLPNGRIFPLDLSAYILFPSTFDTSGQWVFQAPIPNKTYLVGLDVYSCYISYQSRIYGISNSFMFTIQ